MNHLRLCIGFLVLSPVLALGACGGDDSAAGGDGGGADASAFDVTSQDAISGQDAPSSDGGQTGQDGAVDALPGDGSPSDAGADTAPYLPPPGQASGLVVVEGDSYMHNGGAALSSDAFANFTAAWDASAVSVTRAGPCVLETDPYTTPTAQSAGTIGLTGGVWSDGGPATLQLVPNGSDVYSTFTSSTEDLFPPGTTVMIAAAGADVPAFTTQVTAMRAATATALPGDGGAFAIDRAQDLTVSWTLPPDHATGIVAVELTVVMSSTYQRMLCTFPLASGSGTVPKSILGLLSATGSNVGGTFLIFQQDQAHVTAGTTEVTAIFQRLLHDANGDVVKSGPVDVR